MPLLGKKPFAFVPPPEDIKKNEEVFVIQGTKEVFRTYKEYIEKVLLYSSQIWTCQYTGKSHLNFEDAQESEEKALKMAKQFPKCFREVVLGNVHHWTSGLEALVDKCNKDINSHFNENDAVNVTVDDKIKSGKIEKVIYDVEDNPPSPSSDKENPEETPVKSLPNAYDILCDDGEVLSSVKPDEISPATKPPSRQLIGLFIRTSMAHPVTKSGDSVYVVKRELLEKYQIQDKLKDFSVTKKNSSSEPLSTIQNVNNSKPKKAIPSKMEKQKKISPEKHHSESKTKTKKIDPLQRSLDCFRIQQPNIPIKKCGAASPVKVKTNPEQSGRDVSQLKVKTTIDKAKKLSPKMPKKFKKNDEETNKTTEKSDSVPPSGSTTPKTTKKSSKSDNINAASPCKKTQAVIELERCPGISPVKVKHAGDKVMVESLTSDGSGSYELKNKKAENQSSGVKTKEKKNAFSLLKSASSSSNKSTSSKSLKSLSEKKSKTEKKDKVGKGNSTDKTNIEASTTEKIPKEKTEKKERKEKKKKENKEKKEKKENKNTKTVTKKQQVVDLTGSKSTDCSDVVEVIDDSEDKMDVDMAVHISPAKNEKAMQSQGTCKSEGAADSKKKKQKTLSEMFNAALKRDKPKALSRVIHKAMEQNVSPLSLDLNTPAKNKIKEKYEQIKWKYMSAEEKRKIKEERQRQRLEVKRQERLKRSEEKKKVEDTDLELKPIPIGKPVSLPDELTIESFADVLMVVEFIINYKDLLVPEEKLSLTAETLIKALTSGEKGLTVLSRVLFILLNILHQNLRGKMKWTHILGTKLTDMPLTENTAPELARVYLQKIMTCTDSQLALQTDKEKLLEILKEMENQDYYLLQPDQKLKILVALCDALMSSDAIDNFIDARYEECLEMRRQKQKEEQEIRTKKKEEKEKNEQLKKEKEEQDKKTSSEPTQDSNDDTAKPLDETSIKQDTIDESVDEKKSEEKNEEEKNKEIKENVVDNTSDIAKTIRNRRLQIELNKVEMAKKEKEEQERRLKEEEELHKDKVKQEREDSVTKFKASLRMVPLGYDRYHRRYWMFNGINGLYVEDGWMSYTSWRLETPPQDDDENGNDSTTIKEVNTEKDSTMVTSQQGSTDPIADNNDMADSMESNTNDAVTIEDNCPSGSSSKEVHVENIEKANNDSQDVVNGDGNSCASADIPIHKSFRDVPYTWYYYDDVEDIKELLSSLASKGLRESMLHQVLDGEKVNIEKNIKRKRVEETPAEDIDEDSLLVNLRQSIIEVADSITRGNLGEIEKMDKYVSDIEKTDKLAPYFIKLQKSIFPRFLQGVLAEENNVDVWLRCVQEATTLSQLHLLLEVLDTAILWDKSAEGARCKICRKLGREDDVLLLCDECNFGFHLFCLRPALTKIPKGEWKCMSCQPITTARSQRSSRNDESEESDEEEGNENEDYCHSCQEGGDELICCDSCPLVFHKECHDPPLKYTPRGAWSCMECKRPKQVKTRKQSAKVSNSKTNSKSSKKPCSRRNSDEASSSKNRRATKKRQIEEDTDSEPETRKRRKISRKRKIEESEDESEEEEDSDDNEKDSEESGDEEEEKEKENESSDDNEEEEEEESGLEEEKPAVNRRSTKNTRSKPNTKDTRNQREKRKAPSKTNITNPAPSKRQRTNPELEVCETILIELLRSEDSWPFLEPVNVNKVPDYLELVSEPMDFKTIKERLEVLEYTDAEPFVRDIRLVFENCDTYNQISTEVGQTGKRLSKEFENLLKEHLPRLVKSKKRSTRRR